MTQTDPAQLDAWARELPNRFLECRDLGHSWRCLDAQLDGDAWERVMRCTRCRAERIQDTTWAGRILASRYVYPDGYLAPPDAGRMSADARGLLRVVAMQRVSDRARGAL